MKIIDGDEVYGIEDVVYKEETWCEHCGTLEPFTATLDNENTRYCMDCCDGDSYFVVSEDEKKQIEITELEAMLPYFEERVTNIRAYLKRLKGE